MTEQKLNCATCAKTPDSVSKYYFESALAMSERTVKRLWIVIIILLAIVVGTNAAWIYYESQFEDVTTTIEQQNDSGYNNFIGNDGEIYNGITEDYNQETNP